MTQHPVLDLIVKADQAISDENFEYLMDFYADDAVLVIQPGQLARGKPAIKSAFGAIAKHFKNELTVEQGEAHVVEGGKSALVIMETVLWVGRSHDPIKRRATYVFEKSPNQGWLCTIDNSYGTDLLDSR